MVVCVCACSSPRTLKTEAGRSGAQGYHLETLETREMRAIVFRNRVTLVKLLFLLELQLSLLLNGTVGSRPCFPKLCFTGGKGNMALGGNTDWIFKI